MLFRIVFDDHEWLRCGVAVVFGTGRGPILMAPSILCVDRTILQVRGRVSGHSM